MAAITLTAASQVVVGATGVVGDTVSTPTVAIFDGVAAGSNSNGANSAAYTFAGGAVAAGDTIANAELLKGVATNTRLYTFLSSSYATQLDLNKTVASLGVMSSVQAGSTLRFITAGPGVPTATVTTTDALGAIRISLAASISA